MNRTGIEWCDYTWNPIVGCSPASDGCRNCYAKGMARRLAANPKMPDFTRAAYAWALTFDGKEWAIPARVSLLHERLDEPMMRKNPARIFVCSMSDLFHEKVTTWWRNEIFDVMAKCPQHTFIILTKRPENILTVYDWQDNIWLGVSAEDQKNYDARWNLVKDVVARIKFVSVEPMLGPVTTHGNAHQRPDWVIAGPETGPGARECKDEWIEALAAESPCFFDKRKLAGVRREWPAGKAVQS